MIRMIRPHQQGKFATLQNQSNQHTFRNRIRHLILISSEHKIKIDNWRVSKKKSFLDIEGAFNYVENYGAEKPIVWIGDRPSLSDGRKTVTKGTQEGVVVRLLVINKILRRIHSKGVRLML